MDTLISSIILGISNFPFFAILFTLPIFFVQLARYKKLNFIRIGLNYAMILYSLCLLALVFFPLPDPQTAAELNSHYIQAIPFHFIADIVRESPLVMSEPSTYVSAIFQDAVLQVLFNVAMTIPFGMFLRYYFGLSCKNVLVMSLALTLFIEIGQLTGLFFIYKGSYRFCDIDDIMANTLGGFVGFKLVCLVERFIPQISAFDLVPQAPSHHQLLKPKKL